MLAEVPAPLFDEWTEFFALEPWGARQDALYAGSVVAMVYNANRTGGRWKGPQDFFPWLDERGPVDWEIRKQELRARAKVVVKRE